MGRLGLLGFEHGTCAADVPDVRRCGQGPQIRVQACVSLPVEFAYG